MTAACCDDATDCSSGALATCNAGCAAVLIPPGLPGSFEGRCTRNNAEKNNIVHACDQIKVLHATRPCEEGGPCVDAHAAVALHLRPALAAVCPRMGDRAEGAEASMEAAIAFELACARIARSEGNAVATLTTLTVGYYHTAASGAVLKGGGLHMVQFTERKGDQMWFGLIGADWDVEGGANAHNVQGHCFYHTYTGTRYPGGDWEGMQDAEEGDCIGLLLDLDAGSLTVYKNDERLGVMQEKGLTDAAGYRWAVELRDNDSSARIDAVPVSESARMIAQHIAMPAAQQDAALPAGTRLRVEGLGDGVYKRWERKTFGANAHFLDFGDGAQQVALRGLAPSQWWVLPPLAAPVVTVRALEVTGGEPVEVEGVSLDWSVSQLNAAIAERRGRAAELQRLVLGDVALDDEDALLSSCGVVDGTEVHALPQEAGAAA
eukprot:COSAG02_NODE_8123_length_2699_cov_4.471923_2_plen_433_part_01